jgi:hypothetical protein
VLPVLRQQFLAAQLAATEADLKLDAYITIRRLMRGYFELEQNPAGP